MHEKASDLIGVYLRRGMGRRTLMRRLGALGLTAASANMLMGLTSTRALAQEFDWKKHEGKTVTLLLNKHPYTDAMLANI